MCQTDPPNNPAKMSCYENLPDPPARMTRQIYLPEIPPSLLKIPRQNMARQPSPPPTAPPTEQGGGGKESTRPACVHWTGTFTFLMNDYIFLYNTIHPYSTQSGLNQCCGTVTIYYGSGSGSGSDFWKVMVPVLTFEKLWFRFRYLLLKKLRFRFRFQLHI